MRNPHVRRRLIWPHLLSAALLAAVMIAAAALDAARADGNLDRLDEELRFARLEMRGSDGRTFRPNAFILAGAGGAYAAPAPETMRAEQAQGLPADRLPLIGGFFEHPDAPPPDMRGAPVYAVGDAMAVDLSALSEQDFETALDAARNGRLYIITRPSNTVIALRPDFSPSAFAATPPPPLGQDLIGEAFLDGDALVIAPAERAYYGLRPW